MMALAAGSNPTLPPITDAGSGSVQKKEKALLAEIIAKVNDLFNGDLTEGDKLVYVNHVLKGKLLESPVLLQQTQANTKKQFEESPNLDQEFMNAVMDAEAAYASMTRQVLESERVRNSLKQILLGPGALYEALRQKGQASGDQAQPSA